MHHQEAGHDLLIGFIAGAIAGLALGLLLAPRTGAESRALLKEKAGDIRERIAEPLARIKETAIEVGRTVQERLNEPKGTRPDHIAQL